MKSEPVIQPEGNFFDKYSSKNFIVKRIMQDFHNSLDEMLALINFSTILDAGCGEGYISKYIYEKFPGIAIDAFDISENVINIAQKGFSGICFTTGSVYSINKDNFYDLVISLEVLEHIEEPERALNELLKVSNKYLLLSVPNEPIWRISNFIRGKYIKEFGNTPGHINHWNAREFVILCSEFGKIIKIKQPFPWTMVLIEKT